jgi:hypothetical protein
MADNRMYLIHAPTKLGAKLGKRIGWGWYDEPEPGALQKFYDYLSEHPKGQQDDFVLATEDSKEWIYKDLDENGFAVFERIKKSPES